MVPDEPSLDVITESLLDAFRNISRGRRYLVGATGVHPLCLSAREITDWLEAHPLPLPRRFVDEVIFSLDAVCLAGEED